MSSDCDFIHMITNLKKKYLQAKRILILNNLLCFTVITYLNNHSQVSAVDLENTRLFAFYPFNLMVSPAWDQDLGELLNSVLFWHFCNLCWRSTWLCLAALTVLAIRSLEPQLPQLLPGQHSSLNANQYTVMQ